MQERYDTLKNGLKIFSVVAGKEDTPPLLLIHGYPTTHYLWRNCIPALAEQFRVYAFDLPGFGRSDKSLDVAYDLDFFVEIVLQYYSVMNLQSAAIAAHDLGGMIGLGFAARHSQMVDKFIVMNTLPYREWSKAMHAFYAKIRSPFWSRILLWRPVFKNIILKSLVYNPKVISEEVVSTYHGQWTANGLSRKAFSKTLSAKPEQIIEARENLSKISSPTLILWGENDKEMPISLAKQLSADIPNSLLISVAKSGHFLQEDQPATVAEHMLSFLLGKRVKVDQDCRCDY